MAARILDSGPSPARCPEWNDAVGGLGELMQAGATGGMYLALLRIR